MVNILIVNPSVNMRLAAMEMKMYGANVKFAYSSDIPASSAERVFYFLSSVNICFTTEIQGEMEREDRVYLFKRNIFSSFKIMGFKKNMEMSYPELSVGTFTDLLLFKRSVLRNDESQEHVGMIQYTSFNDVLANNRDSFIITSRIVGQGSESVCIWETDFDLASTFNKDYFVFFANNRRIEAYAAGDKLVTIGRGSGDKHLEALTALIPMISKFSFKKESEKSVLRNFNPWLVSVSGASGYLINDYSFGHLSVSMPSAWYDRFANFINSHTMDKKQKQDF